LVGLFEKRLPLSATIQKFNRVTTRNKKKFLQEEERQTKRRSVYRLPLCFRFPLLYKKSKHLQPKKAKKK